jgi:glutamate transport system permease protein
VTAPVLGDALGPRGRRRVLIASGVALVVIAAAVAVAVNRLADSGQLDGDRWRPFTEWAVLKFFLGGLGNTLKVAAVAMAFAMVIGALMALGRLARLAPVRWLAGLYVEFFRGVPLLLLILFSALGLPKYGIDLDLYWNLVIGLVAYNSAVLGEIFRAGILSLDRGQTEAAYAVGLTYWQSMLIVIVPQAARRMIPAIVSQLITLLKDSALGFVIAYEELLRRGRISGEFFRNPLQAYTFVAVVYIVVNLTLSRIARRLEVRQRRRYGARALTVGGVEDITVVAAAADADV